MSVLRRTTTPTPQRMCKRACVSMREYVGVMYGALSLHGRTQAHDNPKPQTRVQMYVRERAFVCV